MLVVVTFVVLLGRLHVADRAHAVADRARRTVRFVRDAELADEEKERLLRRDAIHFFAQSGVIVGLSLLALLLPIGGLWLVDQAGWAEMPDVLSVLQRVEFLLVAAVIGAGGFYLSLVIARD